MKEDLTGVIIVPTNSAYLDVCKNFFELLMINWKDCTYKVVFSICGNDEKFSMDESVYNGPNATLTECIVNASNMYPADYYLVFLGDAFVSKKVKTEDVKKCLFELKNYKINYCRLQPKATVIKQKKAGTLLRYINVKERYAHSFISFIATKEFINSEFGPNITDRDFELKYLELANKEDISFYFDDRTILRKDIFHIMPGIEKGKWDRIVLRKLKRNYPEIDFTKRELISIQKEMFLMMRSKVYPIIPNNIRRFIKNKMKIKAKDLFDTET